MSLILLISLLLARTLSLSTSTDDEQVWYSTSEAAALLGYRSRQAINNMIHEGALQARRRGRSWRVPRSEILRLGSVEAPRG